MPRFAMENNILNLLKILPFPLLRTRFRTLNWLRHITMLTCDNLSCVRGGNPLFSGLGFCLHPGAVLILRGSNGSGKTTLLNIIAALRKPTTGHVTWHEQDIFSAPELYHDDMQYIGHRSAIKKKLTVLQNLTFFSSLHDTHELLPATIHFFGLGEVVDKPVYTLSEGWQRRVALARLLQSQTKLWLLDEPLSHLDEETAELVLRLIAARCNQGGITIMSTHGSVAFPGAFELVLPDFIPQEV